MAEGLPVFIGATTGTNSGSPSATISAPLPAGSQPGDMMIAYANAVGTGSPAFATPSGWNLELFQVRGSGQTGTYVFSKRVETGEVDPVFNSGTSHAGHTLSLVVFRNVGSVGDNAGATSGTTNPVTMVAVSPRFDNSVMLYSNSNVTTGALPNPSVTWSGATEVTDVQADYAVSGTNARSGQSVAYANQAVAGTSSAVTAQMSSISSGTSARTSLVLRPINLVPILRDVSSAARSSAGTSLTISYPASSVEGDFLLLYVSSINGSTSGATIDTPSGWTLAGTRDNSTGNSNGQRASVFWKFRGAETSEVITHSSSFTQAMMHSYVGSSLDTGNPVGAISDQFTNTSSSSQSTPSVITPTFDSAISLFITAKKSGLSGSISASWASSPATEVSDNSSDAPSSFLVVRSSASDVQASAGTYPSRSVTLSSTANSTMSYTVALQGPQSAIIVDSDSGTGADDASTTAITPLVTDTGAGSDDATNVRAQADADSGAASDNAVTSAVISTTDSGGGSDDASVNAVVGDSDSGTGTDQGASSNTAVDSDTGSAEESDATIGLEIDGPDRGAGSDSATLNVVVDQQDSGSGSESDATVRITAEIDTATGLEVQSVIISVSDTGSGTDSAGMPSAVVNAADTGSASEAQSIGVAAVGDSGEGTDSAVRSVEGVLVAPRVYTIYNVSRTYSIEREDRTRVIDPHYRTYLIVSESSVGAGS